MTMGCCNGNCNQGRACRARDDDDTKDVVVDCAIAIVFATVAISMSMVVLSHFF